MDPPCPTVPLQRASQAATGCSRLLVGLCRCSARLVALKSAALETSVSVCTSSWLTAGIGMPAAKAMGVVAVQDPQGGAVAVAEMGAVGWVAAGSAEIGP